MTASLIVIAAASVALVDRLHNPPGDPGGRILAQLRLTTDAVPRDATILRSFYDEPRPDSLDGLPGTQCLDDVVVQVNFHWSGSANRLFDGANSRLVELGWRAKSRDQDPGPADADWTDPRHRDWNVSLENEGPFGWELVAQAPSVGGGKACGG
jgi:hypothetical protein